MVDYFIIFIRNYGVINMKKYFSLCILLMVLALVSCKGSKSNEKIVEDVCDEILNCESYKSVATMLNGSDESKKYNVETLYMKGDYYKVTYSNEDNGTKQIILKNEEGVYALTPSVSKQFKFESLWPNNGSHIYLPTSVITDYINDPAKSFKEEDGKLVLTSVINHKVHSNYKYQQIKVDKKKEAILEVSYFDDANIKVSSIKYDSIVFNCKLEKNDFNANSVINTEINVMGEGSVAKIEGDFVASYIPEGYSLRNNTDSIYVYSGEKSYTIVISDIADDDYSGVSRIYDDFMLCDKGLVFKNTNSSTLLYQNKEIEIIYQEMDNSNIISIFNSISFI